MTAADDVQRRPTRYFLLVSRLDTHTLTIEEFGQDEAAAVATYATLENEVRANENVEVVLVAADSLDTVRTTHSHYFASAANDDLLKDVERVVEAVTQRC